MSSPFLSRDQILAADDIAFEAVEVPEWGGTVRVKALTIPEFSEFQAATVAASKGKKFDAESGSLDTLAYLATLGMVDEAGARLFSKEDVIALASKSMSALIRVASAVARLTKMRESDLAGLMGN
jgi:hypothetical protein